MISISSFSNESPPYLFSTECPWLFWPEGIEISGKSIITVAGSGDVPLYFLYRNASDLIAFDVSSHACMWNELKRALIRVSDFNDLKAAVMELAYNGDTGPLWYEILKNYPGLRSLLGKKARQYWDGLIMSKKSDNPLKAWLRPTDTILMPLLFYLESEEVFNALKAKLRPYRIFMSPIERASEILPGKADILYCSNVCEYLRIGGEDLLGAFLNRIENSLSPGGVVVCYETQKASRIISSYRNRHGSYRILAIHEGLIKPRRGFLFNHSLVVISSLHPKFSPPA